MKPTRVILHCSGEMTSDSHKNDNYDTRPEEIYDLHVNVNGWSDIGYHWIITRDGCKHEGRKETKQGAHAKDNGGNIDSIGICLIGNRVFTQRQMESLSSIYLDILGRWGIEWDSWYGHYEFDTKGKTCPNLDMEIIRGNLAKL